MHSSFDNSSIASDDSVSKRRRHAIYFHRPPVWRYSSYQDGSSSPDMSEDLNNMARDRANESIESLWRITKNTDDGDKEIDEGRWMGSLRLADQQKTDAAPYVVLNDSDSDLEVPLLNTDSYGESTLLECHPIKPTPEPFHQKKPIFCTRLHSYKDIRLGWGEQWAIQEGSVVIGLGPEYTIFDSQQREEDEFQVAGGDLYVVCSLYADLWALCAKVSLDPSTSGDTPLKFAFLPLCGVTLAQNYSAFVQRSTGGIQYFGSIEEKYPGNGLPVMPPRRSHSLIASKQIFGCPKGPIKVDLLPIDQKASVAQKRPSKIASEVPWRASTIGVLLQ
ncbi:uncharacterized protein DSM5745_01189 [Aspergillus mulundensis]|uniref:Uncharacterized protein n=1 Tax=Aspergillus mulundensis TaxID=1810919 RepID=A0A3D8T5N2_9EURO|nr:hypothetical protein DSM5745_01189 [Aspergillus mulundensis]RDW93867.1 hypothetical protein DSM5745_01189 [Aspergillus mulundensis]